MTTFKNINARGGSVYGTGPDWKIILYEFIEYRGHSYDRVHTYNVVHAPTKVHEYGKGHSYELKEWNEIRTYQPREYKPNFYKAPRRELPPPKTPPPNRPRVKNRDYEWAKLYRCYEQPLGPAIIVTDCNVNEYDNKEYVPVMKEYNGDKTTYMDRPHREYSGKVDYTLTKMNFYPMVVHKKPPPQKEHTTKKDENDNVVKETSSTSLKAVTLEEKTVIKPKSAEKKAVVAAAVIQEKKTENVEEKAKQEDDKKLSEEENLTPIQQKSSTIAKVESPTPVVAAAVGAIVVADNRQEDRIDYENEDMQNVTDSSWDNEEVKRVETPPPPTRELSDKHTVTTVHGAHTADRLTPVDNVIAVGAIASVSNQNSKEVVKSPSVKSVSPAPSSVQADDQNHIPKSPDNANVVGGAIIATAAVNKTNEQIHTPSPQQKTAQPPSPETEVTPLPAKEVTPTPAKEATPLPSEKAPSPVSNTHTAAAPIVAGGVAVAATADSTSPPPPSPSVSIPSRHSISRISSHSQSLSIHSNGEPSALLLGGAIVASGTNNKSQPAQKDRQTSQEQVKTPTPTSNKKEIHEDENNEKDGVSQSHVTALPMVAAAAAVNSETKSKSPAQKDRTPTPKETHIPEVEVSTKGEDDNQLSQSPPPIEPVVAVAALNINNDQNNSPVKEMSPTLVENAATPKEPIPSPKGPTPQQKDTSPSPETVATAAVASSQNNNQKTPDIPKDEPSVSDIEPVAEKAEPAKSEILQTASNSKSSLPPEVIATIEAYNSAHDGNEVHKDSNMATVDRKGLPPEVTASIEAYNAARSVFQ